MMNDPRAILVTFYFFLRKYITLIQYKYLNINIRYILKAVSGNLALGPVHGSVVRLIEKIDMSSESAA